MKRRLDEAAGTGAPTYGITPYGDRAGYGYGHTGPARSIGRHGTAPASFPYREEGDDLDDVFPEGGDTPEPEVDRDEFEARLNLGSAMHDQLGWSMNIRDRSSFVGADSRLDLAHLDPRIAVGGELTLERIYTPSARDTPASPRVSGTTRGTAGAPCVNGHDQWEDEETFELRGDQWDPDERAVRRSSEESDRIASLSVAETMAKWSILKK